MKLTLLCNNSQLLSIPVIVNKKILQTSPFCPEVCCGTQDQSTWTWTPQLNKQNEGKTGIQHFLGISSESSVFCDSVSPSFRWGVHVEGAVDRYNTHLKLEWRSITNQIYFFSFWYFHPCCLFIDGQWYIKLTDRYVPYNHNFRFFITTKLNNPHYPPEISTKTTLVNFAIKEEGRYYANISNFQF